MCRNSCWCRIEAGRRGQELHILFVRGEFFIHIWHLARKSLTRNNTQRRTVRSEKAWLCRVFVSRNNQQCYLACVARRICYTQEPRILHIVGRLVIIRKQICYSNTPHAQEQRRNGKCGKRIDPLLRSGPYIQGSCTPNYGIYKVMAGNCTCIVSQTT